jgi:hypothetical protein
MRATYYPHLWLVVRCPSFTSHDPSPNQPPASTHPHPFPSSKHLLVLVAVEVLGPHAHGGLQGRNLCPGGMEPPRRSRSGGSAHHAKQTKKDTERVGVKSRAFGALSFACVASCVVLAVVLWW